MKKSINIDDQITLLNKNNCVDTQITKKEIKYLIRDISNRELPNSHTTSWAIVIIPQIYETANKYKQTYPILITSFFGRRHRLRKYLSGRS